MAGTKYFSKNIVPMAESAEENWITALYIACGVQLYGSVIFTRSSQSSVEDNILNAFGNLPLVYVLSTSPTNL